MPHRNNFSVSDNGVAKVNIKNNGVVVIVKSGISRNLPRKSRAMKSIANNRAATGASAGLDAGEHHYVNNQARNR